MRYVASYLLAALGGNASPSAKDIKKILDSVGIEADDDRLNKVAAPQAPQPLDGPTLCIWRPVASAARVSPLRKRGLVCSGRAWGCCDPKEGTVRRGGGREADSSLVPGTRDGSYSAV